MPSYIGVGTGPSAVAAMKKGDIDAISNLDPVITKLEQDGDIKVVADSRTEAGTRAIFGGSNPAAVLYLKHDFAEQNPNTVQALVNAFYKTLKWLEKASPRRSPQLCRRIISSATRRSISPRSRRTSKPIPLRA